MKTINKLFLTILCLVFLNTPVLSQTFIVTVKRPVASVAGTNASTATALDSLKQSGIPNEKIVSAISTENRVFGVVNNTDSSALQKLQEENQIEAFEADQLKVPKVWHVSLALVTTSTYEKLNFFTLKPRYGISLPGP